MTNCQSVIDAFYSVKLFIGLTQNSIFILHCMACRGARWYMLSLVLSDMDSNEGRSGACCKQLCGCEFCIASGMH